MSNELVLSLFPGIGLLDRSFEEKGFTVVRGPDCLWGGDIRRFHVPAGVFHLVCGGPPCQTFSALANLVRAKGLEPRFGNLIPEFERVVGEAEPQCFLMENVRGAPEPVVPGYAVHRFAWNNCWLPMGDAFGEEQRRERFFSFGVRGTEAIDLRRWLPQAALELPRLANGATQQAVNNSQAAKRSVQTPTVCGRGAEVMVKLGGSGKVKRTYQKPTIPGGHDYAPGVRDKLPCVKRVVTSGAGGVSVRTARYRYEEACRLQGLPADFLADAPFTAQGKIKAVANGVPLPLGRAMAAAIKLALVEM